MTAQQRLEQTVPRGRRLTWPGEPCAWEILAHTISYKILPLFIAKLSRTRIEQLTLLPTTTEGDMPGRDRVDALLAPRNFLRWRLISDPAGRKALRYLYTGAFTEYEIFTRTRKIRRIKRTQVQQVGRKLHEDEKTRELNRLLRKGAHRRHAWEYALRYETALRGLRDRLGSSTPEGVVVFLASRDREQTIRQRLLSELSDNDGRLDHILDQSRTFSEFERGAQRLHANLVGQDREQALQIWQELQNQRYQSGCIAAKSLVYDDTQHGTTGFTERLATLAEISREPLPETRRRRLNRPQLQEINHLEALENIFAGNAERVRLMRRLRWIIRVEKFAYSTASVLDVLSLNLLLPYILQHPQAGMLTEHHIPFYLAAAGVGAIGLLCNLTRFFIANSLGRQVQATLDLTLENFVTEHQGEMTPTLVAEIRAHIEGLRALVPEPWLITDLAAYRATFQIWAMLEGRVPPAVLLGATVATPVATSLLQGAAERITRQDEKFVSRVDAQNPDLAKTIHEGNKEAAYIAFWETLKMTVLYGAMILTALGFGVWPSIFLNAFTNMFDRLSYDLLRRGVTVSLDHLDQIILGLQRYTEAVISWEQVYAFLGQRQKEERLRYGETERPLPEQTPTIALTDVTLYAGTQLVLDQTGIESQAGLIIEAGPDAKRLAALLAAESTAGMARVQMGPVETWEAKERTLTPDREKQSPSPISTVGLFRHREIPLAQAKKQYLGNQTVPLPEILTQAGVLHPAVRREIILAADETLASEPTVTALEAVEALLDPTCTGIVFVMTAMNAFLLPSIVKKAQELDKAVIVCTDHDLNAQTRQAMAIEGTTFTQIIPGIATFEPWPVDPTIGPDLPVSITPVATKATTREGWLAENRATWRPAWQNLLEKRTILAAREAVTHLVRMEEGTELTLSGGLVGLPPEMYTFFYWSLLHNQEASDARSLIGLLAFARNKLYPSEEIRRNSLINSSSYDMLAHLALNTALNLANSSETPINGFIDHLGRAVANLMEFTVKAQVTDWQDRDEVSPLIPLEPRLSLQTVLQSIRIIEQQLFPDQTPQNEEWIRYRHAVSNRLYDAICKWEFDGETTPTGTLYRQLMPYVEAARQARNFI